MASPGNWDELRDRLLAEYPELRKKYEDRRWLVDFVVMRTHAGLTQKQLAERAGTSQSAVARLESGGQEPSLRTLRRLVEAMGGKLEITIRPAEEPTEAADKAKDAASARAPRLPERTPHSARACQR